MPRLLLKRRFLRLLSGRSSVMLQTAHLKSVLPNQLRISRSGDAPAK